MDIQFLYGVSCRDFIKYTIIFGAYIRLWPILQTHYSAPQHCSCKELQNSHTHPHKHTHTNTHPHPHTALQLQGAAKFTHTHTNTHTHKHTHMHTHRIAAARSCTAWIFAYVCKMHMFVSCMVGVSVCGIDGQLFNPQWIPHA
jgi:hypothetical protein